MAVKELDLATIKKLIEPKPRTVNQVGPIRWYDKEMRCANRGCGSPTYIRIQGVPRCYPHTIHAANEMLVAAGFQGIVNSAAKGGETMSEDAEPTPTEPPAPTPPPEPTTPTTPPTEETS